MKKIIASALVLSTLIGGGHAAEAKSQPTCKIEKSVDHKFPNIKNQKTIDALKHLTYKYKGVGIGTTYAEVLKKLGAPETISYSSSEAGKEVTAQFGSVMISAINQTGKGGYNQAKVYSLEFINQGDQRTTRDDIKAMLGKPTDTMKEKYSLLEVYNDFSISYKIINKRSEIIEMAMTDLSRINSKYKENNTSRIKNQKPHKFTAKELLAIRDGKYNFYGLKLWMTPEAAKKAVGGANETSTTRIGKDYLMTQTYGKDDFLSVDYRSNDCGKTYKISNFMVDYDFAKQSLTDIEKVVGKPDRSEKGSYVEEENGVKGKRIPTVMNEYGHLALNAEKINGKWNVLDIQYVR
ncbi:hypothetical protein BHU61_00150 [Macrococcus epidermidis]|uniref:Uncharacterized protein n=1 Tax=Macrococcus epidermidis TaxID=1902580 RepID=A0A327ZUL3_9STAP|nr:hypothetical protein [Macrococcus epidermidis]RAK45889.1 hypothetical protein BHU61_00150 [Macrococcus epidermidis]